MREPLSSVFSTEGTLISASAAPHCGVLPRSTGLPIIPCSASFKKTKTEAVLSVQMGPAKNGSSGGGGGGATFVYRVCTSRSDWSVNDYNNNDNVYFSVSFLLWSTRPIT